MELIIILVVEAALAFWLVSIYNKLVTLKDRFKNAFAQVEVQLKRRYDLIPNPVETAKGYLKHERETLEAVVAARNQALTGLQNASQNPGSASAMKEPGAAEGVLGGALARLNVVVEAYPDLKANANMMQLSEEMTSTENKVAFARQAFNDQATEYNTYKQTFPPVVFAGMFGHPEDAQLLEYQEREAMQAAPKVSF